MLLAYENQACNIPSIVTIANVFFVEMAVVKKRQTKNQQEDITKSTFANKKWLTDGTIGCSFQKHESLV